jgi:hypothetical protein
MSQDPVLFGWTNQKRDRESVYEDLVEAVKQLKQMDPDAKGLYQVVWESTSHNHDSTRYAIQDFDSYLDEPIIYIEGGRGGNYKIITKSYDYPWVQYLPPNQPDDYGWDEELVRLAILTEEFEYVKEHGWRAFLSEPFEVLRNFR